VVGQRDVTTSFGWTNSGKLSLLTPPGKPAHQLTYDARGLLETYVPPTLGGTDEKTTFKLDLDRYLQAVDGPGWDDLTIVTDPIKGRVARLLVGGKAIDLAYYPPVGDPACQAGCSPGRLRSITDNRTPGGLITTFKWANSLPKSMDEAGATVSWNYNSDVRVADETFTTSSHASQVSYSYDNDGLLTSAALAGSDALALDPDPVTGRLVGVQLGSSPKETLTYNTFGELRSQNSTPFRIDYEDLVSAPNVPRDSSGRIKRRIERLGVGVPSKTYNYTYDDQNRLWKVDGAVTNEYRYDDNGNRIYAKNSQGTQDAANGDIVYDAQDRLISTPSILTITLPRATCGTATFRSALSPTSTTRSAPCAR
jgi:hypothetical protein